MDYHTAWHVCRYYRGYMDIGERQADRDKKVAIKHLARTQKYSGSVSKGPPAIQNAWAEFERTSIETASRILRDHPDLALNLCPKCGTLCKTPKSRQCTIKGCLFDWHADPVTRA